MIKSCIPYVGAFVGRLGGVVAGPRPLGASRAAGYRFLSSSFCGRWWPDEYEMLKTIPEIANIKDVNNLGEEDARRALEISQSYMGKDHPMTACALVLLNNVGYASGKDKLSEQALNDLVRCGAVMDNKELLAEVEYALCKLHFSRGEFGQVVNRADALTGANPGIRSLKWLSQGFQKGTPEETEHEIILQELSPSRLLQASHLNNAGGLHYSIGKEESRERIQECAKQAVEICSKSDSNFAKLLSESNEEDDALYSSESIKESQDLALRCCRALNIFGLANPTGETEQMYVSRALKLADSTDEALLALTLGTLARMLHFTDQAVSSEGLYRSSIDKIAKFSPQRPSLHATKARIQRDYVALLNDWEKREVDAKAQEEQSQRSLAASKGAPEIFFQDVLDYRL